MIVVMVKANVNCRSMTGCELQSSARMSDVLPIFPPRYIKGTLIPSLVLNIGSRDGRRVGVVQY